MKRALILFALLVACRGKDVATISTPQPLRPEPPAQDMREAKVDELLKFEPSRVLEGSALKAEPGEPIVLTMSLKESPGGLQTTAQWLDDDGRTLFTERRAMNGARLANFTLPKTPKPGHYRVVGYWGGNVAAEYEFDVMRP